ncbi:ABC transporter substrate-binding protein [Enterococcus sp. ALS3]|uniref:ABC transporter substrate-binding protein n=1 Tax=Enterococcus alishanensis TaxID=1303817 RepID=A0ABS6THH0_9ENTE|nr:ABC transporter substrate-binding protein [Enterococcus alishanensis]MBV7392416.1 ABC transporter substrate-binding protein [Enterococcus alishanensis]
MYKKKFLVIMLACLGLILYACGKDNETESLDKKNFHEITDVRGRTVKVPIEVERAYYPYYYENLLTVVGPNAFDKISATSVYDTQNYSKEFYRLLEESSPGLKETLDVGSTLKDDFDIEKLIESNPDIVILANYQYDAIGEANINNLESMNIPVVFIDYTDLSIEAHEESTRILGEIFNAEERASELIENYKTKISRIDEVVSSIALEDKKSAFFEVVYGNTTFKEYGKAYGNSMLGLLGSLAGADNIYGLSEIDLIDINPEFLFEENPYAIFLDGGNFADDSSAFIKTGYSVSKKETQESINRLINDREGFETLEAVKEQRVFALDDDIMRTMKDYVLIEYIGKQLYPDKFVDFNPEEDLKEFNKAYLPNLPNDSSFMVKWAATD